MITDEVEDKSLPRHKGSKREDEQITAIDGQELAEDEGEDKAEDEDEVQVPDIMPEDARFIPLGFARPRAQTFYKRSDPEWQSFAEFLHDRKRNVSLRGKHCLEIGLHSRRLTKARRACRACMSQYCQ